MDIATLSGILVGFGMTLCTVLPGPFPEQHVFLASLVFVLGGTCAVALLSFSARDLWQAVRTGVRAFVVKDILAKDAVLAMVHLAALSHREGIVALGDIRAPNPVLKNAARLIAGNADAEYIRNSLKMEILSLQYRRDARIGIMLRLALYAPAVGILGTLTELVVMLAGVQPGTPGAGTFGAPLFMPLVATVYGGLLSLLVFLPVAARLKTRGVREEYRLHIIFTGVACILENNNPGLVYEKLFPFLSVRDRVSTTIPAESD